MKNFSSLFLFISIAFGIIWLNSCKKDTGNQQIETATNYEESEAMLQHVMAFKNSMEYHKANPGLKDGMSYTAPDAVYELEALLNFNFCYTDIKVNKKEFVKTEVIMPLDALHEIGESKLSQLYYEEIIDSIQARMQAVNYTDMKLLLVDLEQTGTDGNGDAIISVGALVGNERSVSTTDEVGYWFGNLEGTCEHEGSGVTDATVNIYGNIMFFRFPAPPPGKIRKKNTILTLPEYKPWNHFLVPENQRDNFKDSKLFYAHKEYGTITDDTRCISGYNEDDSEMLFYRGHYNQFIDTAEIDYELDFTDFCINDFELFEDNQHSQIWHELQIHLGHVWIIDDNSLPVEDILLQ